MKNFLRIFFVFLLISLSAWAHPHVFFDLSSQIQIEGKKLEGIHFHLILDEMNSLLQQKILKAKEGAYLEEEQISFLKDMISHAHISWKGKELDSKHLICELIKIENGQIQFEFFLPLDKAIQKGDQLQISFYDKKYYYNYEYEKENFEIEGFPKTKIQAKSFYDKKISFYFRLINPKIYEVTFL